MRAFLILSLFTVGCATNDVAVDSRLETTPRHNEWVQVVRDGRTVHAYVAYPEISAKAPAVILIHENRGLTDFERGVADRLAENGYIAVAPDLLSGMAPGGGRASDFPSQDAAREAIGKLPHAQVMADLHAVADYAKRIPAASGTLHLGGFCWGGARTWLFANERGDLASAHVFYGTGPNQPAGVAGISTPVYGFYGGNDARVNATIARSEELMKAAAKPFDYVIYEGAGHAFMRSGMAADASEANRRAHDQGWERWLHVLRR
ncbi:MAG TPA: dienelactone hydrolase family protein [Thermoanaerobaculia bacterium]|nr:dienelactone hydrolase family protein [Thermoanaerobaculia bacterium]